MDKNTRAVEIFDKLAKVYETKFMDVNLYGDTFDFFCKKIKQKDASILELACGPGNISRYLLNKRPDFKLWGTDLSPNMVELAKINNPEANFQILDCRKIHEINELFDGIMCGFCLPYLSKEQTEKLIKDASKLLGPGGLFYLSTMEDKYTNSTFKKGSSGDEIFMHFYEADYLKEVLQKNNFNIVNTDRKKYPASDGSETVDLVLISERL